MLTPLKTEVGKVGDLAHEARRFRTILWSFEKNIELLFKGTGLAAEVDHAALAEAFSRWRQNFDQTKHLAGLDRKDFTIFAAGMMLKELLAARPITAIVPDGLGLPALPATIDHRLKRWPEGYAYTSFCLSVAAAVLREMGAGEPAESGVADDPGFWDSFRENVAENPANAIAFFDMVVGLPPNWQAPDVPWMRRTFLDARRRLGSSPRGTIE
ncbi:MAG: hypothetical protein IOC82_05430 [Aestuariivirga sp.]|uniref:hypothetical protein n=1 Tax=Aestuariivirga sp. TaxID=2650926 RepID=UPI0025BAAF83|nr:hypothetical protein [Aestuariivirga sp.]MCA3560455.1 hypothetical protein [Aestuariivirga sp.]